MPRTAAPTFPDRRTAMLECPPGQLVLECGYCRRWFLATRQDSRTCSPSCRQALSRARTRKHYLRASYSGAAPSRCSSAEERAMRDLQARTVEPGPSRWRRD